MFPAGGYSVYLLLASEALVVSLRGVGFGRRPFGVIFSPESRGWLFWKSRDAYSS